MEVDAGGQQQQQQQEEEQEQPAATACRSWLCSQRLLPFDPRVLAMMRSHGVLIVNPDVRDQQSILAALDSESVSADSHKDAAFSMSFGCGNENGKLLAKSEEESEGAAEGSLQRYGIVDPHHPSEDELEQHVEADWQYRCDHGGARLAVPPAMDDRRYSKDVSQTRCPQDATERTEPCHSFPDFHKQFVEADNERICGKDGKGLVDETTDEFKAAHADYLRTCPTRNSKELVHALFLHQLRYHHCSLPTLLHVTFDGVAGFYLPLPQARLPVLQPACRANAVPLRAPAGGRVAVVHHPGLAPARRLPVQASCPHVQEALQPARG